MVSEDVRASYAAYVQAVAQWLSDVTAELETRGVEAMKSAPPLPSRPSAFLDDAAYRNYWCALQDINRRPVGVSPMNGWPTSLPVPIMRIGTTTTSPAQVSSGTENIGTLNHRTRVLVDASRPAAGNVVEVAADSEVVLHPWAATSIKDVEARANRLLHAALPGQFQLAINIKGPSSWFLGDPPEWRAVLPGPDGLACDLERLSRAQLRWATLSIAGSLASSATDRPALLCIDEPEAGLHRLVEQALPQRLVDLCSAGGTSVLAATHSPALLDARSIGLVHAQRTGTAATSLVSLEVGVGRQLLDEEAHRLGIPVSDLIAMTRVAVLVEGSHDECVLHVVARRLGRGGGAPVSDARRAERAGASRRTGALRRAPRREHRRHSRQP